MTVGAVWRPWAAELTVAKRGANAEAPVWLEQLPMADSIVCASEALRPWTAPRSTPVRRRMGARVLPSGACVLGEWGLRRGGMGAAAGPGASTAGSKRGWSTEPTRAICASHAGSGGVEQANSASACWSPNRCASRQVPVSACARSCASVVQR